jgi:DNA-binding PadR family transcriptional regulator
VRVTRPLLLVLQALLEAPGGEAWGFELLRLTGLQSGTLYPMLDRLERLGWLTSYWQDATEVAGGRPRRRYYRLTADGAIEARDLVASRLADRPNWAV